MKWKKDEAKRRPKLENDMKSEDCDFDSTGMDCEVSTGSPRQDQDLKDLASDLKDSVGLHLLEPLKKENVCQSPAENPQRNTEADLNYSNLGTP